MYDEFERAVTGKPRAGLPAFGWILIVLAFLFLFGVVGIGFAAHRMARMIHGELSEDHAAELARELKGLDAEIAAELRGLDKEIAAEVAAALAEVEAELSGQLGEESRDFTATILSRVQPRLERLVGDPESGLSLLRHLGSGDNPERALRDVLEGSLRLRTEEGELTADLWTGEDGGSLVIDTPEGEQIRIDLAKEEGGGELVIRTEEKVVRFGAGTAAEGLPGWVPTVRGMPSDPTHLFSALSDEGGLGAVSWETDRTPGAVLDFYRRELEDSGYRIREEHSARHHGEFEGGFWAEDEGHDRVIFIAVSRKDGKTKVLLGYGEDQS
ncbi:MAG: hypothetical protein ACWGSQ_10485 [Longimicrobiales bacterium]